MRIFTLLVPLAMPALAATAANTPLPYNTLLVLPVKLIVAILPRPETLAAATENAVLATLALGTNPLTLAPATANAVLAMLALGTKPDTLAPAIPVSACPLPIILPTETLPVVVIVLLPNAVINETTLLFP